MKRYKYDSKLILYVFFSSRNKKWPVDKRKSGWIETKKGKGNPVNKKESLVSL